MAASLFPLQCREGSRQPLLSVSATRWRRFFTVWLGFVHLATWADSAWVIPGADASAVVQASGLDGLAVPVAWKDTCFDPWRPAEVLGGWALVQASPERAIPPSSFVALVSLSSPFGSAAPALPPAAILVSARLWVNVVEVEGSFRVRVRALAWSDADWNEQEANLRFRRAGVPWSGGSLLASSLVDLGDFATPDQAGWFEVPVDLVGFLEGLRRGEYSGLILEAEAPRAPEIRRLQWASVQAVAAELRPALHVEWRAPAGPPDLSRVPEVVASHTLEAKMRFAANAGESLRVDGAPVALAEDGSWEFPLSLGVHEIVAANSQGVTTCSIRVRHQELNLAPLRREPGRQVRVSWEGLEGWHYDLESAEDDGTAWTLARATEGRDGLMTEVLPATVGHRLFRLKASPR